VVEEFALLADYQRISDGGINFLLSKFGGMQEQRNQKERLQHESCQHQQMQEDDKVTPTSQVPPKDQQLVLGAT